MTLRTRFEELNAKENLSVGGTDEAESSSILDVRSDTQGALLPRMTEIQRDAIAAPAVGLIIFNLDSGTFNVFDGTLWAPVGAPALDSNSVVITDADGLLDTSPVTAEELSYLGGVTSSVQDQIDSLQESDSDLSAISSLATTGLIARTGTGTAATRTITGTTDQVTVTNGDGVSGNPTLSISENPILPGSASLTLPIGTTAQRPGTPVAGMTRYNTDLLSQETYQAGAWVQSGSGQGGINWVTPNDGISATGYNVYADAAGLSPLDGTGGTATVTFATSAVTPLRGTSSYLFTKPASNVQGQGWSKDFTIDSGFINSPVMHTISMLAKVASGTFVTGDMTFWIVDTTSGQVIQPSAYLLQNAIGAQVLRMEFQPNFNSANYRLVGHVATVSALAYSLQFDDVSVSPNISNVASGSGSSVAGSYKTLTSTSVTAGTNIQFTTKMYDTNGAYSGGVITIPVSGKYAFNLSGGYGASAFDIQFKVNGTSVFVPGTMFSTARSAIGFQYDLVAGQTVSFATASASTFGDTQVALQWALIAPLAASGGSSGVVSFSGTQSSQAVTANVTNIAFTATKDSNGAWNGTQYVVPVAGDYFVSGNMLSSVASTMQVMLDGVLKSYGSGNATVSMTHLLLTNLKAGQLISVTSAYSATISAGNLGIFRLSGPAQIAASEKIYASFYRSATASVTANTQTNFDTKVYDSHGAVTVGASWKFTAPDARVYTVKLYYDGAAAAAVFVWKNGAAYKRMSYTPGSGSVVNASIDVQLNTDETIDLRPNATGNVTGGTLATSASWIDIASQ